MGSQNCMDDRFPPEQHMRRIQRANMPIALSNVLHVSEPKYTNLISWRPLAEYGLVVKEEGMTINIIYNDIRQGKATLNPRIDSTS